MTVQAAVATSAAGLPARLPAGLAARRPPGYTPRSGSGLSGYERVLARAGFSPVAGIDEAGRGACAGPLVVAAVVLHPGRRAEQAGIADSKVLTVKARERCYQQILDIAVAWHAVVIESDDIDRYGLHRCNVAGMRRALAGLEAAPAYVLTDGFPVPGLAVPALAMWKGDQVTASVAAASIVAKVTRDRIMRALHAQFPEYGFARHKGYSTASHMTALARHGPSPQHRTSFVNVARRAGGAADLGDPADASGVCPILECIPDLEPMTVSEHASGPGALLPGSSEGST